MSKKKLDLTRDLTRGRSMKKEIGTTEEAAAKVVEKVSQEKKVAPKPKPEAESKKLIRTTIDLPAYVHKAIKIKAATEGISLKKYLVSLVKEDLKLD